MRVAIDRDHERRSEEPGMELTYLLDSSSFARKVDSRNAIINHRHKKFENLQGFFFEGHTSGEETKCEGEKSRQDNGHLVAQANAKRGMKVNCQRKRSYDT